MQIWKTVVVISCLLSCYFYSFLTIFGIREMQESILGYEKGMGEALRITDLVFFILFSIDIILKFITEYTPTGEIIPCREIEQITMTYLQTKFLLDIIPWFPFHYIIDFYSNHYLKWLFIIKVIRIIEVFNIFNVTKIMKLVRSYFEKRTQYIIH